MGGEAFHAAVMIVVLLGVIAGVVLTVRGALWTDDAPTHGDEPRMRALVRLLFPSATLLATAADTDAPTPRRRPPPSGTR